MRAFEQRKKNSIGSSSFFGPKIQKKLKTGTPGDKFEVEADKVADKVVSNNNSAGNGLLQSKEEIQQKPLSETISSVQSKEMKEEEPVQKKTEEKEDKLQKKSEEKEEPLQKKEEEKEPVQKKEQEEETVQAKCAGCEKEDKEKKVQKKENNTKSTKDDSDVEARLNQSKGNGSPMNKELKNEMESKFSSDFSNVNIHTNSNAVQMSQDMGAQAFTSGNDVYFNKGKYNPDKEGKHLLAHELTHTIQQTGAKQKTPTVQKVALENHPEDLQNSENPYFKNNPPLEKANDNEMLISTGHKGGYVSEIQEGLLQWRETSLPNYGADGDFGSETRKAVLDFQIDQRLNGQEGVVGPETMGTLDNLVLSKNGGGKKKKPCIEKPSSTAPYAKNFQGVKTVPFITSEGCFKVRITVNAKCLTKDCESFDMNIDNDKKTQKTVKMDPTTHTKSTSFTFDTLKPGRHEIVFIMPLECRPAFSMGGSEFQVNGIIKVFG